MNRSTSFATTVAAVLSLAVFLASPPARAIDWDGKIQQIVGNLDSGDARVRTQALKSLGELSLEVSRKHIIRCLDDTNFGVQREAARLAVAKKIQQARPFFQQWLAHWDERLRALGAENLGEMGDKRAASTLVRALTDPEQKVRLAVIKALGKLGHTDGKEITPLLGRLNDASSVVRRAAVEVLAKKKDRRVVIPLIGRWRDSSREVRAAVANALGEVGDRGAGPTLMRMSRDYSEDVALAAIEALGKLRYAGATELLIDLLHSGRTRSREKAAMALGALRSDKALKALVLALRNATLRPSAQRALAGVGNRAARHLNELLQDPRTPRSMALAAVEAARQARMKDTTPHIVAQLRLGRLSRPLLIRALGHIGDPRSQRPLLEFLGSSSKEVRAAALEALEKVVDQRAGEPLLRLLDDPNRGIQLRAVRLLGRLKVKIATPKLLVLATGKNMPVARASVNALAGSRDPRAVPILVKLLGSRDRQIRRLSGQALASASASSSADSVLRLCRTATGAVRITCIQALGGVLRGRSHRAALDYLLGVVTGSDRSAFFAAVDALAAMQSPRIQTTLFSHYAQLKLIQKRRVVEIMGNNPAVRGRALPFLLEVLKSPKAPLRAAAAWALGKLGDPGAELALRKAAKDSHWSVQVNATAGLARLRSRKSLSLFKRLASSRNPYLRANALWGIAMLRDKGSAGLLRQRLRTELNPWARLNVLRGLMNLGFDKVELAGQVLTSPKKLLAFVAQKDPEVRVRLVALAMTKKKSSPPKKSHWIGLYLLNMEKKPLRNSPFVLVVPSGLLKASVSNPLGESWEEGILEGRCFVEAPHMVSAAGQ